MRVTCDDPTHDEMFAHLAAFGADEFEIEAAIYWFANDWHDGQTSNLYSALSTSPYKPGPLERCVQGSLAEIAYELLEQQYVHPHTPSNQL